MRVMSGGGQEGLACVAEVSYDGRMKTLSVKIPESLATWLLGEAKRSRRSRSDLVREALEAKRNGNGNDGKGAKKPQNMAEAMAELGGIFNGPTDLSTNPKYFEGFGE